MRRRWGRWRSRSSRTASSTRPPGSCYPGHRGIPQPGVHRREGQPEPELRPPGLPAEQAGSPTSSAPATDLAHSRSSRGAHSPRSIGAKVAESKAVLAKLTDESAADRAEEEGRGEAKADAERGPAKRPDDTRGRRPHRAGPAVPRKHLLRRPNSASRTLRGGGPGAYDCSGLTSRHGTPPESVFRAPPRPSTATAVASRSPNSAR